MNTRRAVSLFLVLGLAAGARAQVVVTKTGADKSTIDFSGFTAAGNGGTLFLKVLQSDLVRSGWFALAAAGGEFRVTGGAREAGGGVDVECQVVSAGPGGRVFGRSYSAGNKEVRALAHKVNDEIVKALTGREGFAQSRLALVGRRTGKKELYLCDSDGENMIQLTRDNSISLYPRWSPDNRRLTYTSFLKGYADAYLVEIGTGSRRRIASYPGINAGAAISPDGRSVALVLSRDGNPELYVMSLADGHLARLTRTAKAGESSPSWSPDGGQICFVSDLSGKPQLYVISRAGGAPRRITSRGVQNVAPDWGRNGLIALASQVGGRFELCVLDPQGGTVKTVAADGADYEDPSWARDGRHIACARTAGFRTGICLVDIMGGEKVMLLTDQGDWFSPQWSR